ncbi:uncharacterized protein LOC129242254 [Anastrepha obliqua]|uniref:uncharacterized protein LOC129242254 n=1 Tax=Anastrepha obliqua TaxID=95512 RepID=UPI0024091CCC|nr:uncharacterized protein LOC129242254 [Anastrepha obliqua]
MIFRRRIYSIMWNKEATKTHKNDDTPAEGIPELTTGCTKANDLTKNSAVESDTLVVATCVVNDDGNSAENSGTVECPTETEPSDINRLLSVVRLTDGPPTSAQRNELNKVQNSTCESNVTPNTTNASPQKSVSATATTGCTVIKDITNFSALTVATDCDELPYTSTNANIKTHAFQQSPKPIISVKYFSPIVRAQNETVVSPISGTTENRCDTNFQRDIVAGPQIQNSNDNLVCLPETDSDTVRCVPTPASQIRALSPANSSVTSMSTPRSTKSTRGRRVVCLRHMRRAPKEPEEYIDALFPHIREAHNQIRGALLHAPLTDVKDNVLLKRKILDVIRLYVSGCKNEFERVGASVILCRRLKRNIFRLLDLFHEIFSSSREDPVYLYHISQLIAVYNSLEIRLSFNLTKLQKCALIHRISHVIHKHLMVKDELLAKGNILRMFLHMPDMYSARFIMEPLFNTFLVEIPTTSNNCCQRELPDKAFVQYIIVLHLWKEMLRDPLEQVELINRAQHFMCPTKTLHTNPLYANHLPTIHTRKNAVKDILNSLKFFHDLKNAAICDDILQDEDDDIEVVIDDVINKPFWDFGATYTSETKHQRTVNLGVSIPEPVECVDLTVEDDQQPIIEHVECPLDWLAELKERASERVQADETENIICLDSDSDGELFSGSIVDPTESYQDCFGVDTDYTSLDSSSTDDKVASEDDVSPTSVLSPSGIRTYLAPKSKKQINSSDDNRLNTSRPQTRTESSHARLRDDDDRITLGTKTSAKEGTLPLIVNTFTVSSKQNMHFLSSPRLSLDIGPERFGGEDMELPHTGDNERESRKIAMQQQSRETAKDQGDGYYENDNDDEDEYHSLPLTSSSTTTNLGKVIYSQALPHPNRRLLPEDDVQAVRHSHVGFKEKDGVKQGYKQNNEDGTKQVHTHVGHKPVKKQVKFNDNPIGPTRCPQTKLPIKPAIHLNKIPNNNQHQQPILSSSPQPRFASPSSSTSSTAESLKQMAQKGRRFVDRFKIQKPKILKSSSAMIVDSKDDHIIDVSASANTKKDKLTVSTQPIESIKAHIKDIPNPYLSVSNSNICKNEKYKMKTGHVSNRSTTIHGPKDISSTNYICNTNVENMLYDSTVCSDLEILELENQVEMEEQNSNVSTTTGPNLESNTADEHTNAAVNEKCIKNQTLVTIESTSSEDCRATSFESNVGSDICTSSTETIAQEPNSEYKDLLPKMVVFGDMQSDKISLESTKKGGFQQQSSFSELSCTGGETSENLPLSADSIATIGSEKLETILEKPIGGEANENECRQCVIKLYDENISKNTSKLAIDLNAINTQQSGTHVNVEKDVHSLGKCNKVENKKATSSEENVERIIAIENETVVSVCHENPISVGQPALNSDNLKEQSAVGSKKSNESKNMLTRTESTSQNTAYKMLEGSENLHIERNIEYPQSGDAAQGRPIEVQCVTQGSSDTTVVDEKMSRKLEQEQVLGAVGMVNTTLTTSLLAPKLKVQTATDKGEDKSIEIIEKVDQNSKILVETSEELRNIKNSSSVTTKDCTFITESEEIAEEAELGSLDVNTNTSKSDKNQIAQVNDDIQVTQTTAEEEKGGRTSVAEVIFLKNSEKSISLKEREVTKKSEFSDDTHHIEGISGGEQQKGIRFEEKISVLSCNTSVNQETAPKFDDQPSKLHNANANITESNKEIKEISPDISINEDDVFANECETTNGQNTSANIRNENFLKQQDMRSDVEKDRNAALNKITADQKLVTGSLIADQAPTSAVVVSEAILENTNATNTNETEPIECIESPTNSLTNGKSIAKVEAIEVHKEVFSSSAVNSSSDGLVRLVAAVNAVEALDLTLEGESENVEKCEVKSTDLVRNYESGKKSTVFSSKNLQTANSSLNDLAANVVAERTTNAEQAVVEKSNKATSQKAANEGVNIVEKDVMPTSTQVISKEPLEAANEFTTTGIYCSGDKSPQTNLERLAEAVLLTEAAAQKCPSTATGRSVPQMEIESTQSTVDQLAAECIEIPKHTTACESDTIGQKVIIDRGTNKDTGLTSVSECTHVKIVGSEFESVIMSLKSQNSSAVPLNSVTDGKSGQGLPSDYPKIMNDSVNESAISIVHKGAAAMLTHDNVKMSKPTVAKQSAKCIARQQNKEKVSLNLRKTVSVPNKATSVNSNPPLSHNTGPTFHSSFEKFVNSQKIKTELKLQRTSSRISQLTATKNISKDIEKTVLPAEISHAHSCVGAAKNSVSRSDINVVVRGKHVSKSLTPQKSAPFAQQSAELVVSPESHTPSVGASKFELKKRYSLRRSEQWKVVKNTSLRASPPTSNSECATTKKTITNTLSKRCIKIRLARAKMPTKAAKKVNPPTPTVQEVPSLEAQFGDVSHRPITRRLAAALNSSLQMETDNAVIEPMIKPSVMRGRKYRPKIEVLQEDAVPTKRKRCVNVANTSSNKAIEVIETETTILETLEWKGKRKECVAEVTKEISAKPRGEKESPKNAFQKNTQIETVLDDTTPIPEKGTARSTKYGKIETETEKVSSDSEITFEAPLEKDVINFETIFIEPLISIKSIRTKNLNSVETTKIEAQPIKEVESVPTANSKEVSIQNVDALVKPDVSLPVEGTIPHESSKTSEKSEESNEVMKTNVPTTVNKNVVETESQYQQDLTQPYVNSSSNEKVITAPSKDILLAESVESAPITCHENSNSLPEKSDAQLVDISNFTSLTLELADSYSPTKSVIKCNPKCIHKCIRDEESTIDLSVSQNEMNEKTENLNNSDSINILKTNMEADKLLEEYNHPARIITNANLKIPRAVQTPTDGRTPACSSVSFSFTGSDTSSSSINSCSCSTSTTDLFKSQPSSFKVVQSQAPVAELLSSTSSSFHGISLLDLEHDVIINNDDLLSELMPTTIIDNITAASLEHNYAIKPLEMVIRNEDDSQYDKHVKNEPSILNSVDISTTKESYEVEDNGVLENTLQTSTEIGGDSNNEKSMSITSLKVSIPLALIKRIDEITADYRKSKDWYLSEKPSTSKAALEALARRRDTQLKTIITTGSITPNVPSDVHEQDPQIFQKYSSKRDIVSADRLTSPCQLVSRENCCQSPSLPLKKRRNISGVLEEDLFNATMLLSAEDNLVTGISHSVNSLTEHKIHKPNEATDRSIAIVFENKNKLVKCEHFLWAEDKVKRPPSENFKAQFEKSTPEKDPASEINSVCDEIERLETTNDQQRAEANVPIDYQHNASSEQLTKPIQQTREDRFDGIDPLAGKEKEAKSSSCQDQIMELITECQNNTDSHIGNQHKSKNKGNLQGVDTCETDKDPKAQEHFFEVFPQFTSQESSEKRLKKSIPGDVVQGNDKYTAENNARESHQELTFKDRLTNCDMLETLTNDHFEPVIPENQEKDASNVEPFEHQIAVCEGQNSEVAFLDQEKCVDVVQMEHSHEVSVPDQPDVPMNEESYKESCKGVGTDCAANIKNISMPEFKGRGIQDLISIQEVQHTKDSPLPNYENHPNEVILTSYDDQFFVTVCLNDSKEAVSGFDDTNNMFKSKEYAEKNFDIGNGLIISTHQIKEESTDLMNMINSSESSAVNLKKQETTFTTDADLLKTNELIEFTENLTNTTPPTNSDDLQLFTVESNTNFPNTNMTCAPTTSQMELFASSNTTALNFNNTPTFTSCEFGIDHGARSRANIADLSQINDLGFVEHEAMQTTQLTSLPIAMEVDQRDCSMGFEQPQSHIILADNQKTDALDCITSSPLQLNSNVAQIKTEQNVELLPVDDVCGSQTSTFPTIKICSTNQTKQTVQNIECEPVEKDSLVPVIPTTSAELPHLTSLSSLSPILPLIKPTTTTIGTTISETTPIFNFSNTDPNTASGSSEAIESTSSPQSQTCNTSENCAAPMTDSIAYSCSEIAACTTAPAILKEKSTSPIPKRSKSQSQTARNATRARASTRVQIVTPQRKSDNTTPELTEKEETDAVVFTNASVSFCGTEFCTNQIAAALPAAYPATPLRYANLYHFEKYIQQLTTLIDVSGIIESARNLYVDKEALAEAHAALLAQATQFDDEGNAISQPLLLKYHKDGTISILNDNDECIILTANMSKMVKKLSLALSILQEQQSPMLGVRARIHALLKQLTQTATAKTVHTTNIISPSVIPTAVVNPTNLAENAQDIDFNALNAVDLYSGSGGDGKQSMQQQVHLINSNEQMYSNWHEVETNGLMTGITNAEFHIANEDQLINIDPLPLLTDEGASGYEHAVAFDFDENSTILSSNESINTQRLENAFELALGRAVEDKNYNWAESEQNREMQHWQQSQSSNEDSRWPMQEHSSSCRDIAYEERVDRSIKDQAGNTVMVNSVGVNTVAIGSSESGIEELSGANNLGNSNATAIGSVITLPPDRQGRQPIKKMIFQTIDDQVITTQPSNIPLQSTQRCRKKVVTKKTEKVAKVRTNTASKRAVVTPAQKSTKICNTSKQSNTIGQQTTPNIHYNHTPQVVANAGSKQTATLHYRSDGGHRQLEQQQQQQQRAGNVKVSTQFVSGTSNLLQQSTPLITIDSVKNLQLFSQQHPQNSALGGSLQHSNNVRFLLATPLQHTNSYQRLRSIDAPPALSPLSSSDPAKNVPAQETLIQYTYQLPQTQPNFGENHPITELQLHSIKGLAEADVVERVKPTDMSTSNATTITTVLPQPSDASKLRMVRPNRKLVNRRDNTETKISFTPNFNPQTEPLANEMPAGDGLMSAQSCHSPLAQQQQQVQLQPQSIQFLQTTNTSRMINSMQQKHEAELEQLRQQLIKQETQNQTELQFQKIQLQPQGQLNVEPSQRMESMMTTSALIQNQPHPVDGQEIQSQQQQQARQPQLITVDTQPSALSAKPHRLRTIKNTTPPLTPIKAGSTRKRGRPRKYDMDEKVFLTTSSDILKKRIAHEMEPKSAKSKQSAKIRPIAATNLNANSSTTITTTNQTNPKTSQLIITPPATYYTLINSPHESQQQEQLHSSSTILIHSPMRQQDDYQQQMRPSFTRSANAFNLIENVIIEVEAASQANVTAQLQSKSHLSRIPPTNHQEQNHLTRIIYELSSDEILFKC